MIIADSDWLSLYALYRERFLLGPEAPFADTATELPCRRSDPQRLRWAIRGEHVPFLRWATEWAINGRADPFPLPGRALVASRLLAVPATTEELETSGLLGIEHGENLWQSGLAVLAFACEAIVTADGQPIQLATGIMRALRRLGSICPGQGESTSPGNDGFGYMLRADAVDDTTTNGQGQRTSNFCDWLGGPNAARGLEPSAGHYLGMLSGLVLARRALLASGGDTSSAELVSEIEARVRACQLFISEATAYWIRRNDGKDVLCGPLAFGVAWPLARLAVEISGNRPGQELANFHTAQLARALVEFDPSTNRAGLVQEILQSLGQALWSGFVPVLTVAISPDAVAILRNSFPDVWLKQVVFALRNTIDQFVIAQLGGSLPTKLAAWLDGDPLEASATGDLARSWWQHCLGRFLDPTLAPGAFDAIQIPLSHILGSDEIVFTAPTLRIQTSSDTGSVTWPPISIPPFRFRPGDQPFFLHLKATALSEEIDDLEGGLRPTVRVRRANNNTPGPELAPDAPCSLHRQFNE